MDKHTFSLIFLIAISSISQSTAQSLTHGTISVVELLTGTLIETQIQFYMQAVDAGVNETGYRIANSSITNQSPTQFGFLNMCDFSLTETSDPQSTVIGRAQGMFGSADMTEFALYNSLNILFTSGDYNGSTLHIVGRDPIYSEFRELSVVGGTKFFRLATGVVTLREAALNNVTLNGIVEFNITVIHLLP